MACVLENLIFFLCITLIMMRGWVLLGALLVFLQVAMVCDASPVYPEAVGEPMEIMALTPRGVIRIDSDADFTAANGVVAGSGTPDDPYIIEGWLIDAQGAGNCIYVGNTTSHFIIRNCELYNASYISWPFHRGAGITLYNVINGTVVYNSIHDNGNDGIYLRFANYTEVSHNTVCNNSLFGIHLSGSVHDTVYNNTLWEDGVFIYMDSLATGTTHDIPSNNTVNGRRVYYYSNADMNNASVPADAGQVLVYAVSNLKVEDLNLSDADVGVVAFQATGLYVANNTCNSGDYVGMFLQYTNHSTVTNNTCSFNRYQGIALYSCYWNTISDNTATKNGNNGIYLYSSDDNTIRGNNCSFNVNYHGISLDSYSETNNLEYNVCTQNNRSGIYVGASGNDIFWNTLTYNYYGVYLAQYTMVTQIHGNNISYNQYGVYIDASDSNLVVANTISYNADYGVYITSGSNDNRIYGNNFLYNRGSTDTYDSTRVQAYDVGSNNLWNSTGDGNYWSDWTSPDSDGNGIVDVPYDIDGVGARDWYPLTEPTVIPEISTPLLAVFMVALLCIFAVSRGS